MLQETTKSLVLLNKMFLPQIYCLNNTHGNLTMSNDLFSIQWVKRYCYGDENSYRNEPQCEENNAEIVSEAPINKK